jgi:aryl-alcohol dehydrogenase-like predicted oxidoreductase
VFERDVEKVSCQPFVSSALGLWPIALLVAVCSLAVRQARVERSSSRKQRYPRFDGENLDKNLKAVETIENIAKRHQAKAAQVALAWVPHKAAISRDRAQTPQIS